MVFCAQELCMMIFKVTNILACFELSCSISYFPAPFLFRVYWTWSLASTASCRSPSITTVCSSRPSLETLSTSSTWTPAHPSISPSLLTTSSRRAWKEWVSSSVWSWPAPVISLLWQNKSKASPSLWLRRGHKLFSVFYHSLTELLDLCQFHHHKLVHLTHTFITHIHNLSRSLSLACVCDVCRWCVCLSLEETGRFPYFV